MRRLARRPGAFRSENVHGDRTCRTTRGTGAVRELRLIDGQVHHGSAGGIVLFESVQVAFRALACRSEPKPEENSYDLGYALGVGPNVDGYIDVCRDPRRIHEVLQGMEVDHLASDDRPRQMFHLSGQFMERVPDGGERAEQLREHNGSTGDPGDRRHRCGTS